MRWFSSQSSHWIAKGCGLAGLLCMLALVACSTDNSATANQPAPLTTARAILVPAPSGMVYLVWTPASHSLIVKVTLSGLVPKSSHPAHIYTGSCNSETKKLYTLPDAEADTEGNAVLTATIAGVSEGIPVHGWSIAIHNGPVLETSMQRLVVACADILNKNTSPEVTQSLQFPLASAVSAKQAISGKALLTITNQTLTVKLTISGLEPGSNHAVHIHGGSCLSQGPALYLLPMLHADAQGNATSTMSFSGLRSVPRTGWYINVHRTTDLSKQENNDPIACGNVQPG